MKQTVSFGIFWNYWTTLCCHFDNVNQTQYFDCVFFKTQLVPNYFRQLTDIFRRFERICVRLTFLCYTENVSFFLRQKMFICL